MPSYTVYEDVCSVDEVQTLSRTCCYSSSSPMMSSSMSSNKSMMMLHNNYNQQYNNGKIISSSIKQNTKAAVGYVDLNVNPHLLTCGPNKENIDPLTGRVYPMSLNIFSHNPNSKNNNCTTSLIRDPLKDVTLSVIGQTQTKQPRLKKLTSSSSLMMTPQKNKRISSASTGSLNPLSPSTLYLR